ncbi:hypothetical protein ERICIV_03385 [Paenibacillus larvae subsp. larvae]|uniref:Uncharacterized protein n=4 Tax=root TaxID=1 RepID=R9W0Q6_9CAUD|nr:hypothetical protein [Paenibacillus larvae]YP_008320391.1 hypothetical protein IBBPl23_52 [Paenibacillus phage phiIBB_P123]YP_009838687.1 hypothetical protein HWB70_gp56 [Paenibacillus phage Yyerffej]YP_009838890.1 hypothetical protein HWB73_gp54 [Paenibacillus phage Eltigre]QVV19927.1 hypothetical protein Neutron_52 [Paenibacillus phage Neutron]AGN89369.1 hypothetical protein IBBPl23_52 [Paenibacillus phage phiIBB_P123]AVF27751.1 hypothetical protein ERICIII_03642 [Paenibacillus larvae su
MYTMEIKTERCEQCDQVKEEILHLQNLKTNYHFCTGCLEKYFEGQIVFD